MNLDEHVGKTLVQLDVADSVSPAIRAILEPGTSPEEALAALNKSINEAIRANLGANVEIVGRGAGFTFAFMRPPQVIETREARKARDTESWRELSQSANEACDANHQRLAAHPDNGKAGVWLVEDYRHSVYVRGSSAPEVVKKALTAGIICDWAVDATYLGESVPIDVE